MMEGFIKNGLSQSTQRKASPFTLHRISKAKAI